MIVTKSLEDLFKFLHSFNLILLISLLSIGLMCAVYVLRHYFHESFMDTVLNFMQLCIIQQPARPDSLIRIKVFSNNDFNPFPLQSPHFSFQQEACYYRIQPRF